MSNRQLFPRPFRIVQHQVRLNAPDARAVVVTGSFCGWVREGPALARNPQGVWQTTLLLPPGRYEYRFLVDGQWQDDPACRERVANQFGSENCVLRINGKPHQNPPSKGSHMTKKTHDVYQKALSALAARLDANLAHERRELMRQDEPDVPGGPILSTDEPANSGAVEVEIGVMASEERLAAEVAAALQRIEAGTFGRCLGCGKNIAQPRLDTVPYARDCIRCARAAEAAVTR